MNVYETYVPLHAVGYSDDTRYAWLTTILADPYKGAGMIVYVGGTNQSK